MKKLTLLFLLFACNICAADNSGPYTVQLEQITISGAPKIHSFAFANYNENYHLNNSPK